MNIRSALSGLSLLLLFVPIVSLAQESVNAKGFVSYSDSTFHLSMDDDDNDSLKAVPIPADILAALRQDDEVRQCMPDSDDPPFNQWFIAIPIDLYGHDSALVLLPQTICVMGANIQGFRIFVRSGTGHKEIFLAYAMSIDLLKTKSSDGHRDIGIIAGSAATEWGAVYRFNGGKYLPVRCWQHQFTGQGNPPAKIEAIPCSPSTEKPYR